MPLRKVGFQERTSQTTDQCNEVAEAKKIIADLQRENAELGTPFTRYPVGPERYNLCSGRNLLGTSKPSSLFYFWLEMAAPHI